MYQQYVNEARVAQYQQQCQRQAAAERSLRSSRPQQQVGELSGGAAKPFLARLQWALQHRIASVRAPQRTLN